MADNVKYGQPASGVNIATDEIGGIHFQYVKLVDGTADSAIVLPGSALGLGVDVRKMIPVVFDKSNLDGFGRINVANPTTIFDSQFQYDLQPMFFEQITANGGTITHLPNEASAQLGTTTTNGSTAALQSRNYNRYQPGKSQRIFMTFTMGAAALNVKRRAGYFDAQNGIFLEQNGTTDLAIVRRTFVSGVAVDNRVTQANWNVDKFDGTGVSGLTLDLSKAQIFCIGLQWLGVGRARVGFDINGAVYWAHEFLNANVLSGVYMTTANLPIRWEQSATTGASAATMKCTCSSVISSGGFEEDRGYVFQQTTDPATPITVSASAYTHLISIRPKATFNSIVNRGQILPIGLDVMTTQANSLAWVLLHDSVLTGGAWVSASADSIVEYNITATLTTPGHRIAGGFSNNNKSSIPTDLVSRYPLTLDSTGANPIVLTLAAQSTGGGSASFGSLEWRELR